MHPGKQVSSLLRLPHRVSRAYLENEGAGTPIETAELLKLPAHLLILGKNSDDKLPCIPLFPFSSADILPRNNPCWSNMVY